MIDITGTIAVIIHYEFERFFLEKTQKLSPNAFILCYYTLLLPLVPIFIEILSIYCLGGAIGKVREYATLLYRFCFGPTNGGDNFLGFTLP